MQMLLISGGYRYHDGVSTSRVLNVLPWDGRPPGPPRRDLRQTQPGFKSCLTDGIAANHNSFQTPTMLPGAHCGEPTPSGRHGRQIGHNALDRRRSL